MPFSQIMPPSPSPTEFKRLFYTSVSLLLSLIQGYRYHLSKFHIYALVYCIGLFKKIRDTKRTFHAKMGSIKDRNGMDITEAEDIKKRWQDYTEKLYKKILMTHITTMV